MTLEPGQIEKEREHQYSRNKNSLPTFASCNSIQFIKNRLPRQSRTLNISLRPCKLWSQRLRSKKQLPSLWTPRAVKTRVETSTLQPRIYQTIWINLTNSPPTMRYLMKSPRQCHQLRLKRIKRKSQSLRASILKRWNLILTLHQIRSKNDPVRFLPRCPSKSLRKVKNQLTVKLHNQWKLQKCPSLRVLQKVTRTKRWKLI